MNKADSNFVSEFAVGDIPVPLRFADREGRFRHFNRAWLRFTGRSAEQEYFDGWRASIHPQDRSPLSEALAQGILRLQPFEARYRLLRHDGIYRWMQDSFTPSFDEHKVCSGWVSASCDVTNLVATSTESAVGQPSMRVSDDQDRSMLLARTCEEIFSAIAHDLRNPLNGVQSWTHVIESTQSDPSPIAERAIRGIKSSIKRQVRLIDELLNAMTVVSGRFDLHSERVALNQCVNAGVMKVQELLDEKKLQIRLELFGAELFVVADPVRMEQTIAGLLTNAAKYSPQSGEITIRTTQQNDQACLEILDQGPRISTDATGSADFLNPFRRSRANDGARTGGWGIAMADGVVRRHGGRFSVKNTPNANGIEFSVLLPIAD